MSDLRALQDKAELHDLVMRYCRAVDRRQFAALRALYHDDAFEDRGDIFVGSIDEFVAWMPVAMESFELTTHRIFNTLFVLDGDRAEGEIYAEAYHRTTGLDAQEIVVGGRYFDHYERRRGVWKFSRRSSAVDRCEMRPVNHEAYRHLTADLPPGLPNSADPSFAALPLLQDLR
ncbi:MAG: hypothetical protein JWM78_3478 [Verrucomicrobiaceae bacterium]|nr:hypothetical protein [Verrucomicrobiaceae bacterium]